MKTFWRQMKRDIFCADRTMLAVFASASVILGILFALGGVNRHVVGCLLFPRGALPSFVMVLLWGVMLAALGASALWPEVRSCLDANDCRHCGRCTALLGEVFRPRAAGEHAGTHAASAFTRFYKG